MPLVTECLWAEFYPNAPYPLAKSEWPDYAKESLDPLYEDKNALQEIESLYPSLQFNQAKEWTAQNACDYINHFNSKYNLPLFDLSDLDSVNSSSGVTPDGGMVFVEIGRAHV